MLCQPSASAFHSSEEMQREEHCQQSSNGTGFVGEPQSGAESQEQAFLVITSMEKWKCPSAWHMDFRGQDGVAEERTVGLKVHISSVLPDCWDSHGP